VLADPSSNVAVSKEYSLTKAEIVFFVSHQFARHVEDILTRRTSITYAMKEFDENLVVEVARLICEESNKTFAWIEEELNRYRTYWLEYHPLLDN
jgi:glycerol-3-phosphate dehydrogenase